MTRWRQIEGVWCLWPAKPIALIEMIGGSYLASNPQLSYRRLLEMLSKKNLAIHAWSYLPGLDHQAQANEAWKVLRRTRKQLEERIGETTPPIRIGHSLGCKLHLLSPDGGRNSKTLIALSFNNFTAARSIPMLEKIAPKLGFRSEFSPSPIETMRIVNERYLQPNNLLVQFGEDQLDQSDSLLECLQSRKNDQSQKIFLHGDHLTPASAGVRQNFIGSRNDDRIRTRNLLELANTIYEWTNK